MNVRNRGSLAQPMIGNGSVTLGTPTFYSGSTNLNSLFSSSAPNTSNYITISEGSSHSIGNGFYSGGYSSLLNSGAMGMMTLQNLTQQRSEPSSQFESKSKSMKASDLVKLSSPPPDNVKKSTVMSAADVLKRAKS